MDSLRYCFNPHFKSGLKGQSKVSDCQEFPVSAQVTEEADRGNLPIKSLRSLPRIMSKKENSGFIHLKKRLPLCNIIFVISTLANHDSN